MLNKLIILFFMINLNYLIAASDEIFQVLTNAESKEFARKVYSGEYARGEAVYYNPYSKKNEIFVGNNMEYAISFYKKRKIIALEGIIYELFGKNPDEIKTNIVANEPVAAFCERRFTELLEYLYFLFKKKSNTIYKSSIPEGYQNFAVLNVWSYKEKKLVNYLDDISLHNDSSICLFYISAMDRFDVSPYNYKELRLLNGKFYSKEIEDKFKLKRRNGNFDENRLFLEPPYIQGYYEDLVREDNKSNFSKQKYCFSRENENLYNIILQRKFTLLSLYLNPWDGS